MGPEGETVSAGDCTRQTWWVRRTEELEGDREEELSGVRESSKPKVTFSWMARGSGWRSVSRGLA